VSVAGGGGRDIFRGGHTRGEGFRSGLEEGDGGYPSARGGRSRSCFEE